MQISVTDLSTQIFYYTVGIWYLVLPAIWLSQYCFHKLSPIVVVSSLSSCNLIALNSSHSTVDSMIASQRRCDSDVKEHCFGSGWKFDQSSSEPRLSVALHQRRSSSLCNISNLSIVLIMAGTIARKAIDHLKSKDFRDYLMRCVFCPKFNPEHFLSIYAKRASITAR